MGLSDPYDLAELATYEERPAPALAFDPPVAAAAPRLVLARDERQPAAFLGYEELIATYFYLRNDDRLTTHGLDRYERRAISEKVGVSYR